MPRFATYREIPQFTRMATYAVDYQWSYLVQYVDELQTVYGIDLDPDFQRGHVWTPAQQSRYIEFILQGGASGRDIYLNHPFFGDGREVEASAYSPGVCACVDGLQRLTAALAFMDDKVSVFGQVRSDFSDRLPYTCAFHFHINDLTKRADVLRWYLEFNAGGTPHTREEIDRVRALLQHEMVLDGSVPTL